MNPRQPLTVIALGGNAISPEDGAGDIPQQFDVTRRTAARLADVICAGRRLVLTHGNGPQVGNVLRRVELAAHEVYALPLDICVADTQGGMGYMIALCLNNELARRGESRRVCTIVTTVEVDPGDPDFAVPTKPVGSFYPAERAEQLRRKHGWALVQVRGRGWRRVVPSPAPRRVLEIDLIRRLADAGDVLIAAGGGGVPVVPGVDGSHRGVEAVIDKDRTSALLAAELGASELLIATSVRRVAVHFGKPEQRDLDRLTVDEARRLYEQKHFAAGSMGPKIVAAIDFLTRRGDADACVVICHLDELSEALNGRAGTRIVRG